MSDNNIEARIADLRRQIDHHNRLYYQEAAPEISDRDYDMLYSELLDLEAKYPEYESPGSPTRRVGGAPLAAFETVRHAVPMMSLDNTYSKDEIGDWMASLPKLLAPGTPFSFIVEPKIDGVAFTLRYEHGRLRRAATRGSGTEGDDVTTNIRTIRSIPLHIPGADAIPVLELRGEVYMTKEGFKIIEQQQFDEGRPPIFKNARNAAAGSLKQLDPRVVAATPLDAILYGTGAFDGIAFETQAELIRQMKEWGVPVPPRVWTCPAATDVLHAIDELETVRHDFPFEIDGAVIKVNERALYEGLGVTAKSPRWARAYKYAEEQAESVIAAITVQVGRTGVLTPVAELEPVFVSGSEIQRATLHNFEEINRLDIRIGDHVHIKKGGEVIPDVVDAIIAKRPAATVQVVIPDRCPSCNNPVQKREGEVAIRCENIKCPEQEIGLILHFGSRQCMDIEALGEIVAESLVTTDMAHSPFDLFCLDPSALGSLNLGTKEAKRLFGKKNADKVLEAVDRARAMPLDRWIHALGIPNVGKTVAIQIAQAHPTFADLAESSILRNIVDLSELQEKAREINPRSRNNDAPVDENEFALRIAELSTTHDRILSVASELQSAGQIERQAVQEGRDGIRKIEILTAIKRDAAQSMIDFFNSERGRWTLARMQALGINPTAAPTTASTNTGTLAGKTFVLTGTLERMPRDAAGNAIRERGGNVATAVSGKTDYLVAGTKTGSRKIEKAHECNVQILDEIEFLALLDSAKIEDDRFLQPSSVNYRSGEQANAIKPANTMPSSGRVPVQTAKALSPAVPFQPDLF